MDATTMAKTSSLLANLKKDHPTITFTKSDDFYWSPQEQTVYYAAHTSLVDKQILLHETGHAILNHQRYNRDLYLLKMEREAWELAKEKLSAQYGIPITSELIEDMLESYREWLHARSLCPKCQLTGLQTNPAIYQCLGCNATWHVNEARRCRLKRTAVT